MNEFDFADRSIEIAREIRKMAIDKDVGNRIIVSGCIMQHIMLLDIC